MLVQSQAYSEQYGFNGIHLLTVNLFGPEDDFNLQNSHVIPALIRKIVDAKENKKDKIVLWGTGNSSREFLYVEDCVEGIILAAENYNKPFPINLGSGIEIKVKDLAEKTKEILEFTGNIIWDPNYPDGQPTRCLDTSKAEKEFGFKAKTPFEEGLKKTIEWYLNNNN
jgi:GDP-L-fucose synthase